MTTILDKVKKGRRPRPKKILIYAVHKFGKSTLAGQFPEAIFIDLEDGVADLDVASTPTLETLADAWGAILEIGREESDHNFETIVVDSIDWLERLIHVEVCNERGVDSIADVDFGKGYSRAFTLFSQCLDAFGGCLSRGMNVVLIGHAATYKVEPPGKTSYSRWAPKLRPDCTEKVCEWADAIIFGDYRVDVRSADEGFNRERGIAIGRGERVLYTADRPAHVAGNRLGLEPEILLPEPYTPEAAALVARLTGKA